MQIEDRRESDDEGSVASSAEVSYVWEMETSGAKRK
jgi:hypothetical protein